MRDVKTPENQERIFNEQLIMVMEPCKGGTLAIVPEKAENLMKEYNPEASIPS